MRNSKLEIRRLKTGDAGWYTRSVLECGDSSPLSLRAVPSSGLKRRLVSAVNTLACIFALFFLLFDTACSAQAQSYSIDWSTIDGGGGTSTGGVYSVTGTIGQPDAGAMSGGNYTSQGGFWGIIAAVQTPGAPLLTITLNSQLSTINVSWPSPSTGWTLQQNTNSVSSVNWSNITATIQDDGTTKTLIVNPPVGNRFFRLNKP